MRIWARRTVEAPNRESRRRRHSPVTGAHPLRLEQRIRNLIAEGTSLHRVLNELCIRVAMEVGDAVSSMFLFPNDLVLQSTVAERAARMGLCILQSECIVSAQGRILGVFEVYCYGERSPDSGERLVIKRAAELAALAIEQGVFNGQDGEQQPAAGAVRGPAPKSTYLH